jgi:acetyltransferase-like isoleucine patch superfamily enzyme
MTFIMRIYFKLLIIWWDFYVPLILRLKGVEIGKKVKFYGMPIVDKYYGSRIIIESYAVLCSHSRFTALGVNHPVILRTLNSSATITIGENSGLSGTTICSALGVDIGRECLVGANVIISDTDFHSLNVNNRRHNSKNICVKSITICNNVFLGVNTIVLNGSYIGENSVIGAGSVVKAHVPENQIWAGQPVKYIRSVDE